MEADFRGYATKAGLKCTDGRTIMPDAFKHQDQVQVPLVWQHGHKDPENILGHAILENREDGVYAYGFLNKTSKARHIYESLIHGDITMMSIWANELVERSGRVFHGAIREVSLVLSGANPGAKIEHVTLHHADGSTTDLDDEGIIYTGLPIEILHADADDADEDEDDEGKTVADIYNSMTEEQKEVVHYLVGEALESKGGEVKQDNISHADLGDEATVKDIYDSMTDQQKDVLHYMVGEAISNNSDIKHNNEKGSQMGHNVFESQGTKNPSVTLSHDDMKGILSDATRGGSLRDAVDGFALAHGIEDIDLLFPDAVAIDGTPEWHSRRTEWVNTVLSGARKSPFSRIKTFHADITEEDARAKGYVKGEFKKEEFFPVVKRTTTPTTIYKKQKLDRDDVIDITDFDVIVWLKGEMRLMLDEELARAILIGDGRDIASDDKINEQNIRPIATDHELYTVKLQVNLGDGSSSIAELMDILVLNRHLYKGSGVPTMFVKESVVGKLLALKDTLNRRIYKDLSEVANELRVASLVPVEVLEGTDVLAILVNMTDYVIGATAGGQVSFFDDFDIDYNQQKYLIETRCCGALTKLKSAIVVMETDAAAILAVPEEPTFDAEAGELTIPTVTGVVYKNEAGTTINAAGSPYAVASGATYNVYAYPATGYYFASSDGDTWSFTAN